MKSESPIEMQKRLHAIGNAKKVARAAALEEAAKMCDEDVEWWQECADQETIAVDRDYDLARAEQATSDAKKIREALKEPHARPSALQQGRRHASPVVVLTLREARKLDEYLSQCPLCGAHDHEHHVWDHARDCPFAAKIRRAEEDA